MDSLTATMFQNQFDQMEAGLFLVQDGLALANVHLRPAKKQLPCSKTVASLIWIFHQGGKEMQITSMVLLSVTRVEWWEREIKGIRLIWGSSVLKWNNSGHDATAVNLIVACWSHRENRKKRLLFPDLLCTSAGSYWSSRMLIWQTETVSLLPNPVSLSVVWKCQSASSLLTRSHTKQRVPVARAGTIHWCRFFV